MDPNLSTVEPNGFCYTALGEKRKDSLFLDFLEARSFTPDSTFENVFTQDLLTSKPTNGTTHHAQATNLPSRHASYPASAYSQESSYSTKQFNNVCVNLITPPASRDGSRSAQATTTQSPQRQVDQHHRTGKMHNQIVRPKKLLTTQLRVSTFNPGLVSTKSPRRFYIAPFIFATTPSKTFSSASLRNATFLNLT